MTETAPASVVERALDFILENPPYAAVSDERLMESVEALLDMDDGWPADFRTGFGRKTDAKGTSQVWTVNAGDLMLLLWLAAVQKREAASLILKQEQDIKALREALKLTLGDLISTLEWQGFLSEDEIKNKESVKMGSSLLSEGKTE